MHLAKDELTPDALLFLQARHLATLTTLRTDGSPHVTPVGFTFDPATAIARVICDAGSRKATHVRAANLSGRSARAALCQVDGRHWLTLEATASVSAESDAVGEAVERYTARYRPPRVNPNRVVILLTVDRVLGTFR